MAKQFRKRPQARYTVVEVCTSGGPGVHIDTRVSNNDQYRIISGLVIRCLRELAVLG